MGTIRAAAARHPWVVDAVLPLALAGVLAPVTAEMGTATGVGWVWFVALHVLLGWRRRAPLIMFWCVAGVAFTAAGFGAMGPALLVVPMVACYAIARYRPRRHLWPAAALVVPFAAAWLLHGGPWWDVVALAGLFAASALLGTNVQTRQAYLAELEERARRLEHEREQQARLAIAAERVRIAREMHDIVAHNLAVMVALADGAVATTPVAPRRAVDLMEKASATGREALTEIRRLVGLLRDGEPGDSDDVPAPQPGFDDIDDLIGQVRAAGLTVALTRDGVPGDWGSGAGLAAYRIVQEALTNTMKHAGPQATAEVRLRFTSSGMEVEIIDDGGRRATRPAHAAPSDGHGLVGMTERVAPYGGAVTAEPGPGTGWRVHARVPFNGGEIA